MRKALFVLMFAFVCGVSFAASKVSMFGAPNSSGTGPMEVDSDRAITVASDATFTVSGTTSTAAISSTALTASGVVTLSGVASKTATGTSTTLMSIATDGVVYGVGTTLTTTGNIGIGTTTVGSQLVVGTTGAFSVSSAGVITDTAIYAATSGTGLNRTVCVDSNGKFFSSAAACP